MKHYSLVLIFAYFFMAPLSVKAVEHTDKDLSLVVLSCDKYSELWDNFFKLLYRQ